MAKVTELSEKELEAMITKHEKTLQLLYKEKQRRTGKVVSTKVMKPTFEAAPQTATPAPTPEAYQVVIDDEFLASSQANTAAKAKAEVVPEAEDETANMRLTRVLKLSKEELESFNRKVEEKTKKK